MSAEVSGREAYWKLPEPVSCFCGVHAYQAPGRLHSLPPRHQPQCTQHHSQMASWVPWGVSNYCATLLLLPGEHPEGLIHLSSSTHLHTFPRVFPVLVPSSQRLGKNGQKLAVPATPQFQATPFNSNSALSMPFPINCALQHHLIQS